MVVEETGICARHGEAVREPLRNVRHARLTRAASFVEPRRLLAAARFTSRDEPGEGGERALDLGVQLRHIGADLIGLGERTLLALVALSVRLRLAAPGGLDAGEGDALQVGAHLH